MNIEKLKAAAEAATLGPWKKRKGFISGYEIYPEKANGRSKSPVGKWAEVATSDKSKDANFIALANPTTILELIRQREVLMEVLSKFPGWIASDGAANNWDNLRREALASCQGETE